MIALSAFRRVFSDNQSRNQVKERKSVKIGGVTKAPEESGGSSLQFLQEVTSDVLARGIFSERGLKSAIDSAVTARLGKGKVSNNEREELVRELRRELGLGGGGGGGRGKSLQVL